MTVGWLETSFPVKDVGVTRGWYEKLGFQAVSTADAGKSVTMQAGECRLALYEGVLGPAEPQLIFWQGDVEGCAETLTKAGVTFEQALKTNDKGTAFMVRDPDGQLIYVIREPGVTKDMPAAAPVPDLERGFVQVSLPVKDPNRTAAFYEMLGFRRSVVLDKEGVTPDPRVAALTNGECRICLYQGYLDPDELQLNFWQGDIDAVAARVREHDLGFLREPHGDDKGAAFMLTDPDGRPIFFINMGKYTAANFVSETGEMLA
ncbi:MAG TPA: VOC family protein [Caulobacteraceae bacterium]|jgi:catechol 2,3-dioxygenase-like lactoylglutathione lyase family enzyme